jgi:hypothetical protein
MEEIMIQNKGVRVERTEKCSIELNASDLVDLLRKGGYHIPPAATSNMRVYFAVPGGGDWSNTDVAIDDRNPVYVEWVISEEKTDG